MGDELRVLNRLNLETRAHHGEADADIDDYLFRAGVTAGDYRTFLIRTYGFVAPVEAALFAAPGLEALVDVRARAKAPLLAADLVALGMTFEEVQALPACDSVPTPRGPASALGWMYVLERPLLSAAVIRGHLASFLHTEMQRASSYLQCYSGNVGTRWRELGEAMDSVAYSPGIADRIVAGANDAFRALTRWRSDDRTQPMGIIRIAG